MDDFGQKQVRIGIRKRSWGFLGRGQTLTDIAGVLPHACGGAVMH